jgi:hypothetical protein
MANNGTMICDRPLNRLRQRAGRPALVVDSA